MKLSDSELDKAILFKFLKEKGFNVYEKIKSIHTWNEHESRGTYTMVITVPMRIGMIHKFDTQNWSIKDSRPYFTINKKAFDLFYDVQIRNNSIDSILDLDN